MRPKHILVFAILVLVSGLAVAAHASDLEFFAPTIESTSDLVVVAEPESPLWLAGSGVVDYDPSWTPNCSWTCFGAALGWANGDPERALDQPSSALSNE